MNYELQNEFLKISIASKGAELQRLLYKPTQTDYLWSGDPTFWGKFSPVLFPIVGGLKEGFYTYQDKKYTLSRHGFARDKEFELIDQSDSELVFLLSFSEETLSIFPFPFSLIVNYELIEKQLKVTYQVTNVGENNMYFSIGAHPAFKLPVEEGLAYSDYNLEFNQSENSELWPLATNGLIDVTSVPYFVGANKLQLEKSLFENDALVFKDLKSSSIRIRSKKSTVPPLRFDWCQFPYMGIWAAPDADFVCLEPWCGIADSVSSNQKIEDKEGIVTLAPDVQFERSWSICIED